MSNVAVYVWLHPDNSSRGTLRAAIWRGQLGWPSAPSEGSQWLCCDEGMMLSFDRVTFRGPGTDGADLAVEVKANSDSLQHLVESHAFEATYAG